MSESVNSPLNFGGIIEAEFSNFDSARVLVFPVGGEGATAVVAASRNLELYEEETDAEVYKIGIHTLEEFEHLETPELMINGLYERTKELLKTGKFLCMIGGEHSVSTPIIRTHAEKYHNLSVLQIAARANLRDTSNETIHSNASIAGRVFNNMQIPTVLVGIRSISADEARFLSEGIPTKIYWARDVAGRTHWIDDAIGNLTENVYLTIDVNGFDPSLVPTIGTSEPGGLGWYETLTLIRKLAEKKRIVGMDLVEFSKSDNQAAPAFLCAKLIYKSLAYIFKDDSPKIINGN